MNSSDDLNRLIDDVASFMTTDEASVDVRRRVLDRLEGRRPRRWTWALVPVVVGLAILVVAVARNLSGPTLSSVNSSAVSRASSTHSSHVPIGNAGSPIVTSVERPTSSLLRVATRAARSGPASAAAVLEGQEHAIPALQAPAPLTVESIQPQALQIRPLYTAPLIVPPVDEDEGRR